MFTSSSQTVSKDSRSYLERQLIIDFLATKGYCQKDLKALPGSKSKKILTEASIYASNKLAEIQAKHRYLQTIHFEE